LKTDVKKFKTISGVELKSHYKPEDLKDHTYETKLGDPGHYPFTRGITEEMYREKHWVMGLYSGFSSAKESNKRFKHLIEQGQTGFAIAMDLPTQMGLDSDHPMCDGEVGKVGVPLNSLRDMEELFDGVPLEKVRQIRTAANANSLIYLSMVVAFARKNNIEPNDIGIWIQNDVLKEYVCRGTYIFPPKASVKLAIDTVEYCVKNLPNWTPMAVTGYHFRDAGGTAYQELAFAFADVVAYVDAALERGLDIDAFAPKLFMFLGAHIDLGEEVSKYRAARRIWARLMKERYSAKLPESCALNIFSYTQGGALAADQPLNNIIRVTIEALGAILGGAQTLATSSYDEAFATPTQEAATIALRTQQIIAHESGVANTVDMLGGSYAIEKMTDQFEEYVFDYLDKIDGMGGAVACVEKGYFQQELSDSAYKFQKSIDSGERPFVGVNMFREEKEVEIPVFKVDDSVTQTEIAKLKQLKSERDNEAVEKALENIKEQAREDKNLAEPIIEAITLYATNGEICEALKQVYGTYRPPTIY
jgi:methylmalonyl-CoA mutase N-terminal domain/subunit